MPAREQDPREVGVKELTVRASAVIARVEEGQRMVVTRRRRPAALLIPMSHAREFVLAFADEFVEMRRVARKELAREELPREEPHGHSIPNAEGWRLGLTKSARIQVRRASFPRRRAWRLLRQLAVLAGGETAPRGDRRQVAPGSRWQVVAERGGKCAWALAGHHILLCDIQRDARTIDLLAVVHRSGITRWIWSGALPPLKVTVATHLDGARRRSLEDAD